jgi:RHS repeat-associated protein
VSWQRGVTSASKSGVTETFKYDGLNRQVSWTMNGVTTYSVWDGWNLVEEYRNNPSFAVQASYLYGPTGPIKNLVSNNYYYQDGSGSTSHLADGSGNLLEWYRYDLQGTPVFYDASNNQLSASSYSVRHLFTGQQWYSELGLYDLRNRFYSPDIGRFLQPDGIRFDGDPTNLYRYCRNNPVRYFDPTGLEIPWGPDYPGNPNGTVPVTPEGARTTLVLTTGAIVLVTPFALFDSFLTAFTTDWAMIFGFAELTSPGGVPVLVPGESRPGGPLAPTPPPLMPPPTIRLPKQSGSPPTDTNRSDRE